MLTKQEKKIIKDEFINLENFIMFYNDLEIYNNNKKGLDLYFDLTPFTSKGIVTGVFALVNYEAFGIEPVNRLFGFCHIHRAIILMQDKLPLIKAPAVGKQQVDFFSEQ